MTNIIATLRMSVDVPENEINRLAGDDDGTEEYYEKACKAVVEAIQNDTDHFLQYAYPLDVDI